MKDSPNSEPSGGGTTDEQRLIERLRFLQAALASSGDGVLIVDARGYLAFVNDAGRRMVRRVPDADSPLLDQLKDLRVRYPDGRPMPPEETPLARALRGESVADYLLIAAKPDGGDAHFRNTVNPVRDESGQIVGAVSILRDVTEQMRIESECLLLLDQVRLANEKLTLAITRAESETNLARGALARERSAEERSAALRASEERLRTLATIVPVGIFVADAAGNCTSANERLSKLSGLPPEQLMGQGWVRALHPEDRASFAATWHEDAAEGREFARECRFARPDGGATWVSVRAAPVRDQNGAVVSYIGAVTNIAERRIAEEAARESEERLRLAQQVAHVGSFEWNIQTDEARWSPELEAMYGLPPGSFPGTIEAWAALVHPDDRAEAMQRLWKAIAGERAEDEWRVMWPDGTLHWIAGRSQVFRDESGRPSRMVGVNIDITERKSAESERERLLAEVERRAAELDAIVDGMAEGLIVINPDEDVVRINRAALQMIGAASAADFPKYHMICERLNVRNRDGAPLPYEERGQLRALRGEEFVEQETLIDSVDGVSRRLFSTASPVRDEDGKVVLAVGIYREVTRDREIEAERERMLAGEREARAEFQRQVAQMKALLASLREGVSVVDATGRIVLTNRVALEITGLREGQLDTLADLRSLDMQRLDGSPLPFEEWPLTRAWRGEIVADFESRLVRPDGERRQIVINSGVVRDEAGQVELALIVFRDVTELRRLEQMREEFISLISHDLRAPLSVLKGYAQLLHRALAEQGQAREAKSAEMIVTSADRMNSMIQDLVESSRLESGTLKLNREAVDLPRLISDIAQRAGSPEDRARIEIDCADQVPPVLVDPARIERAILNLLSNALKYSPPTSRVTIRVERRNGSALVSVIDRGVGIPRSDVSHIFERFYRAKTAGKAEGLGLGLYITRLIVEAHGGRIWAESEVGQGSTFTFALPLEER